MKEVVRALQAEEEHRKKPCGMKDCVRSVGLEEAWPGRIESGMGIS